MSDAAARLSTEDHAEGVLRAALAEVGVDDSELLRDTPLEDLGVDSFDVLHVLAIVEDELEVSVETEVLRGLQTVGDLIDALAASLGEELGGDE